MIEEPILSRQLDADKLSVFFPLFQAGVDLRVENGCTVTELLTEQFGIPEDYISSRITTIFLNHKAVDDAGKALVTNGSTLALSGAMPGLVGATMRSGGHLAALRGAMTYHNPTEAVARGAAQIRLKLFNLLLNELAPRFLAHGIIISTGQLKELKLDTAENVSAKGDPSTLVLLKITATGSLP